MFLSEEYCEILAKHFSSDALKARQPNLLKEFLCYLLNERSRCHRLT